jgi:hypothetical protein
MRLKLIIAISAVFIVGTALGAVTASGEGTPIRTAPLHLRSPIRQLLVRMNREATLDRKLRAYRRKVVKYRRQTCHWQRYAFMRCRRPGYQERRELSVPSLKSLVRLWRIRYLKAKRFALSFGYAKRYLPPSQARIVGQRMAARFYRWTGSQWDCLDTLWGTRGGRTLESGWYALADNPTSDAHGIPQALPGSKMGPGWWSNVFVQIRWGLGYVAGKFGNPCGALSVRLAQGSY